MLSPAINRMRQLVSPRHEGQIRYEMQLQQAGSGGGQQHMQIYWAWAPHQPAFVQATPATACEIQKRTWWLRMQASAVNPSAKLCALDSPETPALTCALKHVLQVQNVHRVSEARDVHNRAAPKVRRKCLGIQRGAHQHQAQIWSLLQHVLHRTTCSTHCCSHGVQHMG